MESLKYVPSTEKAVPALGAVLIGLHGTGFLASKIVDFISPTIFDSYKKELGFNIEGGVTRGSERFGNCIKGDLAVAAIIGVPILTAGGITDNYGLMGIGAILTVPALFYGLAEVGSQSTP